MRRIVVLSALQLQQQGGCCSIFHGVISCFLGQPTSIQIYMCHCAPVFCQSAQTSIAKYSLNQMPTQHSPAKIPTPVPSLTRLLKSIFATRTAHRFSPFIYGYLTVFRPFFTVFSV